MSFHPLLTVLIASATFAASAAFAADPPAAKPVIKAYPLDTCIVTGEKLGSMGAAIVMTTGDQEIKLCCKGCIKTYEKDPAKYLAKLTPAGSATAAATAPAVKPAAGH